MSFPKPAEFETLASVASHLRDAKCVQLAAFAILIYDHALTFPLEVERIWKQKVTGPAILFLLNRYVTPLQYIVIITAFHLPTWTGKACDDFVMFEGALSAVMSNVCEVIMILRVYALYGRSNKILAFLGLLWLLQLVISLKGVSTGVAVQLPPFPPFVGCILTGPNNWFSVVWVGPLVTDTAIFVLMLWRIRRYIRSTESIPLLHIFVRDGLIYFLVIFLMNFMNALLFFLAPEDLKPIGAPFSAMMTAVMISRLVLNLRSAKSAGVDLVPSNMLTRPKESIAFESAVSRVIGNLGEDFEMSKTTSSAHEWRPRPRSSSPV
ncbi:hypothetical protein NLJ89_g5040 [Agrocybe chaxingu]|uniref:DUF6533 domain-containing protein n=1 Tax=Agrocybe chaxingu TaxID=84603 RepID=A0A9W8K213_9AGAR|nr:hypothetical protein NLJ89_g5040 [Agrocybe chaxingu]